MNNAQVQWVALPNFFSLDKTPLKYPDSLIYIATRSYLNSATNKCFPAQTTIASRAGVSKDYVIDSLKRLQISGLIDIKSSKKSKTENNPNQYTFKDFDSFEMIPISFFDISDLSLHEKGMLLCIRQFFNHGGFSTSFSVRIMAANLGITPRTVNAQLSKLIMKGYVTQEHDGYTLTDKIEWLDAFAHVSSSTVNAQHAETLNLSLRVS